MRQMKPTRDEAVIAFWEIFGPAFVQAVRDGEVVLEETDLVQA